MATIGGEGGIRRPFEQGREGPADAVARAAELAHRLAAMLAEQNARAAAETARLLTEVPRLPAEAQKAFLAEAAGASGGDPKEQAAAVRERIAEAYPEGSEQRRRLGALLVSMEGGEPRALSASVLEAKVTRALAKLGAAAPAPSSRTISADTMERARSFGPFGGPARAHAATPPPPATLEALPAAWQPTLARAQEIAPGLANGIVSIGHAESAVAAVRRGLTQVGEGQGLWARARTTAGEDTMGRIAARFEGLRDRLGAGVEAAATLAGAARGESLAVVAQDARGEAVGVRQDIAWARELVPDVELDQVGSARNALGRAEEEMQAAEYSLQGYAAQQELAPERITPEVIEQLRASGQVPPEIIAQLESGDITPEVLAQLQGGAAGGITPEELSRIGTGITGSPAQGFWNVGTVGAGMDPAVFHGEEYTRASHAAADAVLGENPASVRAIEGAELAAAIRDMGVPLEMVDPSQLSAALNFINTGASGAVAEFGRGAPQTVAEQRERLSLSLKQFRYLAEHGPAQMDRRQAIEVMWSAARIPGHAFEKMSDADVGTMAQQVAAACNTPGNHEFKVGSHTVKLTIGESNSVDSTSTKPPSFWSKVGKIANIALTVCSFIPGPVGLVARGIQAGIALVKAIKNGGGFLDILAAGASFVGAGAAAVGRIAGSAARVAGNVARVANAVSGAARGIQGIQRGGLGGIISGVAGVVGGIAGGIQGAGASASSALGRAADDLSRVSRTLGQVGSAVGAAEGYIRANRAVSAAREALEQARASGDPAQIRQAEQQLAEAERGKRSAVLGGLASVGQIAGDTLSRNSAGQPDPRTGQVPPKGRTAFQVGAEVFSRGMNAARGVNDGDLLTAGVEALGGIAAARQGTRPIGEEVVVDRHGRPVPLTDANGQPIPERFQTREDFDVFNQASSVLDGLNDWHGAERGERQAREAVSQAEEALGRARASGDAEAVREAEASLRRARQGLVQAELGSTLAQGNAAERFTGAVGTFRNSRAADSYLRGGRGSAAGAAEALEQVLAQRRASGEATNPAAEAALGTLRRAQAELDAAEASGDVNRIQTAAARLGVAETAVTAARDQVGPDDGVFASLRPPASTGPTTPAAKAPVRYRIRPGDNPTVIAARITEERAAQGLPGISARDIMEANGLTEASSRTLQPGQYLEIRDETLYPELVLTTQQLQQQRLGARDTRDGNVRVGAGESLERYAEMLGVKDKNAWMAEVRRRNPQLSADGRIYEGQLLDLPPGPNRVGPGSAAADGAAREGALAAAPAFPEVSAQEAQRRRFAAEDAFEAINGELDGLWEDVDLIEQRLAGLSWPELMELREVARSRGVDLQQKIIDNIQTDAYRDRLVAHLAGDHRAANNMGLREAIDDARGGFLPPDAEDRQRVIDRMRDASDPQARAQAIALLEEQAGQAEARAALSRKHHGDDLRDLEQRAASAQTWVEQAREANRARSEAEALDAIQEAEWQRLRAQGGTAEQARALAEVQSRQLQALESQHQSGQAAFEFRRAMERGDREAMQTILDTVADPATFARNYAERYVPGILPAQLDHAGHFVAEQMRPYLSPQELDRARASLNGDTKLRDAHRISAALDANLGITPDYATIQEIQRNRTPEQWQEIQQRVEDLRGRSLAAETRQMMSGVEGAARSFFGTGDLIATHQMATDTYDVHARILHATAGLGTDDGRLLQTLNSPEFQALPAEEKRRYREQLLGGPLPELSGIDALRADFALRGPARTPQEALQRQRAIADMEASNVIHDGLRWLDESPLARTLATTVPATAGLVAAGRGVEWYLSDQRGRLDRSAAEVDRFLAQVGDGPLSPAQQLEYNRLMREIDRSTQAYVGRRDQLANYAGMAATTVVGVGATVASGGTLAPALLAFAAAGGAAANAGVRYAIRGSSTSLEDLGRDGVTGAVNAGMTVVGGSLGNTLRARYVASRGGEAALSFGQRAAAGVVEGAPDGFIGGFAGGFTDTALAEGTFADGFGAGFGRSFQGGLEGGAFGGVFGGAMGAGMSTAGGLFRRGAADGSIVGAGSADTPAAVRPDLDAELAPELEPVLLRRPKGVPDQQVVRASYVEGSSQTVKLDDLPDQARQEMLALAQRRQAGIERRDVLIALEDSGKLTREQGLELTKVRAEINEASRRLGEEASDAYMAMHFPGVKKVYPPPGTPSRPGDFDQVWAGTDEKGNWIVVEAKGGHVELKGRWASDADLWYEQGSPEYFNEIVKVMRNTDEGFDSAMKLGEARLDEQPRVRYLLVHAPIAKRAGGLSSLRDIQVKEFDLRGAKAETLARAPGDVLAGGRPAGRSIPRPQGGSGQTSGLFYRPSVTGDPNLPAGVGGTNRYGDIVYSTRGSATDQALALEHERLHSLLSPKLTPLRKFRADVRMGAYKHSQLMKYLEEALAETYAQLKVNGVSGLPSGIRFPIANGYVQLDRVLEEGAAATVAVGGITYGVYLVTDSTLRSDR